MSAKVEWIAFTPSLKLESKASYWICSQWPDGKLEVGIEATDKHGDFHSEDERNKNTDSGIAKIVAVSRLIYPHPPETIKR